MLNLFRILRTPAVARTTLCFAVGSICATLSIMWVSLCGSSALSIAALATGFAAGTILWDWLRSAVPDFFNADRSSDTIAKSATRRGLSAVILTTVTWFTPSLLNMTLLAGCETFGTGNSFSAMLTMMLPALIVAAMVALTGLFVESTQSSSTASPSASWVRFSLLASVGFLLPLLHAWLSIPLATTVTAAIVLAAAFGQLQSRVPRSKELGFESETSAVRSHPELTRLQILHLAGATIAIVAGMDLFSRIIQLTLPVLLVAIAITGLSLTLICHTITIKLLSAGGLRVASLLVTAALPLLYFSLVDFNLLINTQSGAASTLLLRAVQLSGLLIAALLPFCLATKINRCQCSVQQGSMTIAAVVMLSFAAITRGLPAPLALAIGILTHSIAAFVIDRFDAATSQRNIRPVVMQAMSGLPMAIGIIPLFCMSLNFSKSSSLLFSPRTIAAVQRGVSRDLIQQSDASRLVESRESDLGTLSVWRRAGHVYEFQQNGVSLGRVSADTDISPQPAEEILPAILAIVSHPQPSRILVMGDDTGACLRSCTHFPVQEIVALRSTSSLTDLAKRFTWSGEETPADQDSRVTINHSPQMLALRDRSLKSFDVIIAAMPQFAGTSGAFQYTTEFYRSAFHRLSNNGVFCQRLKQSDIGPRSTQQIMASMMQVFKHVGVIQTIPGELAFFATNSEAGLFDPEILARLQREHVKQEIAGTGWDWSQVAVLPLIDANDPIGMFSHENTPRAISIQNGGFVLRHPMDALRKADKNLELQQAFSPHQMQLAATLPVDENVKEAQRRLTSLQQQLEILSGMPDQPWTYRKSLRMEMQRDPRPPIEVVRNGQIIKQAHPLDELRKDYFQSLGEALQFVTTQPTSQIDTPARGEVTELVNSMNRFTNAAEPLLSHFAHYEIIRLGELARLPAHEAALRHRLHIVFFTTPSDASVRPVISALEQVVNHPELVPDDVERYDVLNSLVQKLIERWEARTAWEPRSALRVQNDVEKSVRVVNLAMDQMEVVAHGSHVNETEFLRRRRYITAALIGPLRDYRDQVLAHRLKSETASLNNDTAEPNTEDPSDLPLLLNQGSVIQGLHTD